MAHLLFITTKEAWGGSEFLWCDTAGLALARRHRVSIVMPIQVCDHPRLEGLARQGARILFRPARVQPTLSRRIARKMRGISQPETQWWRDHFPKMPDAICVSQGGTYCALGLPGLVPWLTSIEVPFFLLCQSNRVNALPSADSRTETKVLFGKAAKICFVAQENLKAAIRFLAMPLPNATVIQNPVSLADTSALPWPGDQHVRMACVARLVTIDKGQDLLLEALGNESWKDRNFELSLVGTGPDREILRDLILYYRLSEKVRLTGFEPDLRCVWKTHHILILPSLSEGTPLSLIEAQLCARPAVVTHVDGNPDWVEEGVTGFLAEAPTVHHIGMALERAWERRGCWEEMGQRARVSCLKQRDGDPAGTMLDSLLAAAISHKGILN